MKSDLPKVLHAICGQPMLSYVLSACRLAGVDRLLVVVGQGKEQVIRRFEAEHDVVWVEQSEQKGTGHAVRCCCDVLEGFEGSVLVIAADMPLVRRDTLASLLEVRERSGDAVTLATTELDEPAGYGRIIRDAHGRLEAIVEHGNCTARQRRIREVNPSYYCFDARRLFGALEQVQPNRAKAEYYLTDLVQVFRLAGNGVSASVSVAPEDAMGINSQLDLAEVSRVIQDRIQLGLMEEGVTIVDPDNTWIESDVSVGRETIVYPFTMIETGATIGDGCRIGPFARVGVGEAVTDGTCVGPVAGNGATAL